MWVGPEDQTHLYRDSCVYLSEQVPSLGPLLSNTSKRFDHVLQKAWRQLLAARTRASLLFCVWLNDMKKIKKKTVCTNQKQYEGCEICYTNNGASAVQAVRAVSNSACGFHGVHERQHILSQLTKFMSLRYMCVNTQMQNPSLSLHGMSHFGTKSMLKLQNHSRTFHNIDATGGKTSTWR